ncbi:MAG: phosphate signaling complex protein PhoU [Chloroflexi bacterium]|nr:phosphate signaling complex protein PhoU [Chloroflexota bacterium]
MKLPRLGVNLYKVVFGVGFSLLWAKVMYTIWRQPSFITFVWFYLGLGSLLLKWVFFEIIDRIHMKLMVRGVRRELEESYTRVRQPGMSEYQGKDRQAAVIKMPEVDLEEKLRELENGVLSLADMAERAIERSVECLQRRDMALAAEIVKDDRRLDYRAFGIREGCMRVIATSFLKIEDLRMIVAVLGIITELERIGDYAEGIANITLMIGEQPLLQLPMDVSRMAGRGLEMLRGSVESFKERDVEKAKRIYRLDDDVDALYDSVFRELLLSMVQDRKVITQATRLVWVAHNLERFADRVTNICEWVIYRVTGEMVDMAHQDPP